MLARLDVLVESKNFTSGPQIRAPPTTLLVLFLNASAKHTHKYTMLTSHLKQTHFLTVLSFEKSTQTTTQTTNFSNKVTLKYTKRAGVTAAAGTRLALSYIHSNPN